MYFFFLKKKKHYCRHLFKGNAVKSKNHYKWPSKLFKTIIRGTEKVNIILTSAVDTTSTLGFCLSLDEYDITIIIIIYHPNTAASDRILEHAYYYR